LLLVPCFLGRTGDLWTFRGTQSEAVLVLRLVPRKNVNLEIISKLSIVCIVFQFVRVHARLLTFVKRLEIQNRICKI
jgi:hypothetical protein